MKSWLPGLLPLHARRTSSRDMLGYPDTRFIFDLAVLRPGAHCLSVTVRSERRGKDVLAAVARDDFLIIEDDYEDDVSFGKDLALKPRDHEGRVLYLGTLSKVLAPGMRLGNLVAPPATIQEARWLRRLIHRSAPLNNQRAAGIFLAEARYRSLVRKLRTTYESRWQCVMDNLATMMPRFRAPDPCHCGRSVWLECPEGVDARDLFRAAAAEGIMCESGDPFVPPDQAGRFLQLGLSVIKTEAIVPGMQKLGEVANRLAKAEQTQ